MPRRQGQTGRKPKTTITVRRHRSTCLRESTADTGRSNLDVEFKESGARYRYFDVSDRRMEGLKNASSVGKYFNRYIRNDHDYQRLSGGRRKR